MTIHKLMVKGVRNIDSLTITPSSQVNILYGLNGSGKTSVLEAIYLLGVARSFRSSRLKPVIQHEKSQCTVFGQLVTPADTFLPVGVSRDINDDFFQIRVAGESLKTTSELARFLPLQLINPDTFKLLEGAPKVRRQFLDWGVFHVKHRDFLPPWKRAQKALKQRNSLLRHGRIRGYALENELTPWTLELARASSAVDHLRSDYFAKLVPVFNEVLEQLTNLEGIRLSYYRGWDKGRDYSTVLQEGLARDVQAGYTQSGPQRADLRVRLGASNAIDILSRGQLKLVVCALKLAQGVLYSRESGKRCVFLVDDLPSELDRPHRVALCKILQKMQSQVFITCVEQDALSGCWLPGVNVKMFHVKQGRMNEPGRENRQAESLEIEHD